MQLVKEDELTGTTRIFYLGDGTAKLLHEARIEVDTAYFVGCLTAMCEGDPLGDVGLGNIERGLLATPGRSRKNLFRIRISSKNT
ncbi:hypothetical protein HPB50_027657 [Hyalomma asiaticum]|nr:hypothetical protein HPB50_027657 [Hyalomma asiaticum]